MSGHHDPWPYVGQLAHDLQLTVHRMALAEVGEPGVYRTACGLRFTPEEDAGAGAWMAPAEPGAVPSCTGCQVVLLGSDPDPAAGPFATHQDTGVPWRVMTGDRTRVCTFAADGRDDRYVLTCTDAGLAEHVVATHNLGLAVRR